jgi:gliding motility-associated-like protein
MTEIQIKQLPTKGRLVLGGVPVTVNAVIPATQIANNQLQYVAFTDSTGTDLVKWNASDGYSASLSDANIIITIKDVNDPPAITVIEPPESDTLKYELGSEIPVKLTELFDARDADGDNLIGADIRFFDQLQYRPRKDQFLFTDTLGIIGNFNEELGILTLTGKASVEDYVSAIRAVRYNFLDATKTDYDDANSPERASRKVSIRLSDGEFGQTKERLVGLTYTPVVLDIANAFTPTGNNPYWNIYSPNGLGRFKDALIRVYNKRGTLVYEATGFNNKWNGIGPDGSTLPPDSYYYTIDLNYDKKKYQGVVTILR